MYKRGHEAEPSIPCNMKKITFVHSSTHTQSQCRPHLAASSGGEEVLGPLGREALVQEEGEHEAISRWPRLVEGKYLKYLEESITLVWP